MEAYPQSASRPVINHTAETQSLCVSVVKLNVEAARFLKLVGGTQQKTFLKMVGHELKPDRQTG